jgi:hypothetical protein
MRRHCHLEILVAASAGFWLGAATSRSDAQEPKPGTRGKPSAEGAQDLKNVPRVSLLRLQVVKPDPPQGGVPPGAFRPARFRYTPLPLEGTSLTFLVEDPDRLIHGIETKDCRITRFEDDKGTNLREEKVADQQADRFGAPGSQSAEGSFAAEIDPDGHRATVTVRSPLLPAGGAGKILLEANLVFKFSRGEKTVEQKNVNLKLDKITAAPFPLIVGSQSEDGALGGVRMRGMPNGTQVMLFHQGPIQGIKKITFVGADGNEIQATPSGGGSSGTLQHTYYNLAKKVETCTIRITVPEVVETSTLAISVTTGVGFSPGVRRRLLPAPDRR